MTCSCGARILGADQLPPAWRYKGAPEVLYCSCSCAAALGPEELRGTMIEMRRPPAIERPLATGPFRRDGRKAHL